MIDLINLIVSLLVAKDQAALLELMTPGSCSIAPADGTAERVITLQELEAAKLCALYIFNTINLSEGPYKEAMCKGLYTNVERLGDDWVRCVQEILEPSEQTTLH